jgi:tRNA threonylcarbamoyladenosine biosynthesis protein TsaB
MNVLALDTSTPHAAVVLGRSDGSTFVGTADPAVRHGRALIPCIHDILRAAGAAPSAIDAIAAGLGPGSYTGLRIGLTAAKSFAYALEKPLFTFDSLEVVARNAPAEAVFVSVIADAQRGDVFAADFARSAPGARLIRLTPTHVQPAVDWRAGLPPDAFVLGPAVERWRQLLSLLATPEDPAANHPRGPELLALALETIAAGRREDPWLLEPIYLRRSAAEDQFTRPAPSTVGSEPSG